MSAPIEPMPPATIRRLMSERIPARAEADSDHNERTSLAALRGLVRLGVLRPVVEAES